MSAEEGPPSLHGIPIDELHVDAEAPASIYNFKGTLLVNAGQIVDASTIELLRRRVGPVVYVGPDWPELSIKASPHDAPPEAIVEEIRQQYPPRGDGENRRQHERHRWCVPISIEIREPARPTAYQAEITTHDLSLGGFGFSFNRFLHPGTIVFGRFDSLPNQPTITGVVRSCVHLSGFLHRIGIEFLRHDDEPT